MKQKAKILISQYSFPLLQLLPYHSWYWQSRSVLPPVPKLKAEQRRSGESVIGLGTIGASKHMSTLLTLTYLHQLGWVIQ